MAIASNFPSSRPSLLLDFAQAGRLDPRISFSRASSATVYDGVTTAKAEENLVLQSQDFTTTWTNLNSTDTADTTVAPDGTTTADTITDDATNGSHTVYQTVPLIVNTTFTFSCFLKAGTSNYGFISVVDDTGSERYFMADFDLSSGTVRTSGAGTFGTLTSSSITEFPSGSGWYRCVIVGQISALGTAANYRVKVGVSDGTSAIGSFGTIPYVGTGSTIIAWGAQLEQRSAVTAYTATTTQPITNYIPVLQTAAAGVARFDHNPTTGEALGLLIEEQRANLCLQSEDLGTTWTASNSSVTTNTIVAPDGTLTGDKLIINSGTNLTGAFASQSITKAAVATTYTLSVYYKAGEYNQAQLLVRETADGANSATVRFNALTGEIVSAAAATGTFTSASASAGEPVGNGWFRFALTFTTGTETSIRIQLYSRDSTATTGDGYSGIFIWGAQLEAGAFATSYIKTTSASVTRNADVASMTGTNFSSWFNNAEGANYFDFNMAQGRASSAHIAGIGDASSNTASNRMQFALNSSDRLSYAVVSNGTTVVTGLSPTNTGPNYKIATVFKTDDYAAAVNSGTVSTDTSGASPIGLDRMTIGSNLGSTIYLNGTIRKIAYYPQRLTDAQLQALTG